MNSYVLLPSSIVPLKEKFSSFTQVEKVYDHKRNSSEGIPWPISTGKKKMQLGDACDNQTRKPKVEPQHSCSSFCYLNPSNNILLTACQLYSLWDIMS